MNEILSEYHGYQDLPPTPPIQVIVDNQSGVVRWYYIAMIVIATIALFKK